MKQRSIFQYIKIVAGTIWWLMLIATVVLLVCVIGAKLKGQVPQMFGCSVMRILTNSMEPEIAVGDYILVKECDPADVRQGDIISFYSQDLAIYGMPNTHRVTQPPVAAGSGYIYITQGDNNYTADKLPVNSEHLIGIYAGTLDWLTSFSNALDSGLTIILLFIGIMGIVIAAFVPVFQKKPEETENS